jgi:hypothetical protein
MMAEIYLDLERIVMLKTVFHGSWLRRKFDSAIVRVHDSKHASNDGGESVVHPLPGESRQAVRRKETLTKYLMKRVMAGTTA